MAERRGEYLKKPGRATAPVSLVSVVTVCDLDRELGGSVSSACRLFRSALASVTRRVRDHWSAVEDYTFGTTDAFWAWLEVWARPGHTTHIVCPTASDSLAELDFFPRLDAAGAQWVKRPTGKKGEKFPAPPADVYGFRRLVLAGAPDIIDYTHDGRSYSWVSGRNYFPEDPAELLTAAERSVNATPGGENDPAGFWPDPARVRCRSWLIAIRKLCDWWRTLNAGSWAPTAGSMGERFLRSRMPARSVTTHRHPEAQRLERLAAHRGRTSCWFYGTVCEGDEAAGTNRNIPRGVWPTITSKAYHVDVRSMYPYLLSCTDMPVAPVGFKDNVSVERLASLVRRFACTASVMVDTPEANYPHRTKAGIVYPVGRFTAHLSGAELTAAVDAGHIAKVYSLATYEKGRPFATAASELLAMRSQARAVGDVGWELFVKVLSNSLTGKLAQRSSRWVERPAHPPMKRWGEWPEVKASTGDVRRYRSFAGLVWEKVREEGGRGTLTACYGHLTAACSAWVGRLRAACPPRTVLSVDTDGFWCLPAALDALQKLPDLFGDEPGKLRVTSRVAFFRAWGAKHYYADGRWKLSGIHCRPRLSDGITFLDTVTANPFRNAPVSPAGVVVESVRDVSLSLMPTGCTVGADGWAIPFRLPAPMPAANLPQHGDDECDDGQNKTHYSLFDHLG